MKGLLAAVRQSLVLALREPLVLFLNTLVPSFCLLVFGSLFGQVHPKAPDFLLAGLCCMSVMGTALYGLSSSLVTQREQGILRRYAATPVRPLVLLIAEITTGLCLATLACSVQLVLAILVYDVQIRGSLLLLALCFFVGALAFLALGLIIGSLCARIRTAMLAANALFLPYLFLGGAAVPVQILPDSLRGLSHLTASRYFVDALTGVIVRGEGLREQAFNLGFLAATFVLCLTLCALLVRFDSHTRLRPAQWSGAALVLGTLFTLGFVASTRRSLPALVSAAHYELSVPPGQSVILVDDFDDGDLDAAIPGRWRALDDRQPLLLGSSQAHVAVVPDPSGTPGQVLRVVGTVGREAGREAFAGAALDFTTRKTDGVDLRPFRALRFRVRGSLVSLRVQLVMPPATEFDQPVRFVDVGPAWRTVELPFQSFRTRGFGEPIPARREQVLSLILAVVGSPQQHFELFVDDLELVP